MKPFTSITTRFAQLPEENIDTDQLIPARFMKEPRDPDGYGRFLLADLGAEKPDTVGLAVSAIEHGYCAIIAGPNFGCGSSREAAVYALVDAGVRAVIAPSFGDIFFANAANNGLLALRLQPEAIAILKQLPAGQQATIDLQARQILADDLDLKFEVEEAIRAKLLNGWDDLDLTLSHEDAIAAWHQADLDRRPWAAGPANNPTIGPLA